MSRDELLNRFLGQLREVAGKFEWRVDVGGKIRTPEDDCLLTAVCRGLTGQRYAWHQYPVAAGRIGLPIEVANDVVVAADWPAEQRQDPATFALRQQLKEAVGLPTAVPAIP